VDIEGDDIALFHKFIDMLNEADDVQNIYHNAIVKDA
jgi:transcriptional/translational regulatory protein YebC/TACO1